MHKVTVKYANFRGLRYFCNLSNASILIMWYILKISVVFER